MDIKAHVSIGPKSQVISGNAIEIETPAGVFQVGVDNNGEVYISASGKLMNRIVITPSSGNRVNIAQGK